MQIDGWFDVVASSLQLFSARHGQQGETGALRERRALAAMAGTAARQQDPLAFLTIEPTAVSPHATHVQTDSRRNGNECVIDGCGWWASRARKRRGAIFIVMGNADTEAARQALRPMVLVPRHTKGLTKVRPMKVFHDDNASRGHMEMLLATACVPAMRILLGEGCGVESAKRHPGPQRIHHCMGSIDAAGRGALW